MPTCVQSINAIPHNEITALLPNTVMPLTITPQIKQLFFLEIVKQETIKFTIKLNASSSISNIGVSINIYQESPLLLLGTVLVTELNMSFQKDLAPGAYIICVGSTMFSYSGTLLGVYTGFQTYAKLKFNSYVGCTTTVDMAVSPPERECNKTLYFQIVDGELPPRSFNDIRWKY